MIDQCVYLEKILQRVNLINARVAPTPLPQGYYPMAHEGVVDPKTRSLFQQVIGSLLYLMLRTCPDITYAVITLSKHAAKPSKEHLDRDFYICHYLLGSRYYSPISICRDNQGSWLTIWSWKVARNISISDGMASTITSRKASSRYFI